MKRLSRSDSSMMVAEQIGLLGLARACPTRSRSVPAAPSTAASGVLRSCEIEVSSAERSRSVSTVRLARSMSSTRWTRSIASAPWSISASSRRRWSGVSSGPGLSLSMPTTPIAPRPVRIGRNRRLAPGSVSEPRPAGAVVLPRPVRRGEIGLVERVLRRIAGLDGDRAVLRQQQHDADLQHQRGLIGGRPQHVVERADAGELAAEGVERLRRARPRHRRHGLGAHRARRRCETMTAIDDEEDEGRDVGRIGDRERVDRRQEEEIVAERCSDAGEQRRPQAVAHRHADDRRQEHEIDVLDAEPGLDQLRRRRARRRPRAARPA